MSVNKPTRPRLRWKGDRGYYDHGGTPRRWEVLGKGDVAVLAKWEEVHAVVTGAPKKPRAKPVSESHSNTVEQMVRDYMEAPRAKDGSALAPDTIRNYKKFQRHLGAVLGHLDPSTIDQAQVIRYLKEARAKRASAKGEIGLLSMSYVAWMEDGRLTFNPCFGVKIKLAPSRRTRLLSPAELDAIIAAAPESIKLAIELAYTTGLRVGDVLALRWSDIDAESIVRRTAKTGELQHYALTPELRRIIERCRKLQAKVASLYVLCRKGGQQWNRHRTHYRWTLACLAAGVKDARFHDIRAAAATAVEKLSDTKTAQRFLGHRQAATTEVYLRDKRANFVAPLARKRAA